jgi:phosphoglycolate phosphatase
MPTRIRTIVLDLDGTLVDSAADLAQALNAALDPIGRRRVTTDEVRDMIGDGIVVLTRRALDATGKIPDGADFDAVLAEVRRAYDVLPPSPPYPGVTETLRMLKAEGFKLAICTNKPEGPARRLMGQLGFDDMIDALAGGDTYAVKKPDAGHVEGLLEALGTSAHEAVMVGDSANDTRAAQGAGVKFIGVSYGYCTESLAALGANAVIENFKDLPKAIAGL